MWAGGFPVYVEYLLRDTLLALRPKLRPCASYQEARQEVENVRRALGETAALAGGGGGGEPRPLDSIAETDAECDDEEAVSESARGPPTDDTTTEDELPGERTDDEEDDAGSESSGSARDLEAALPAAPRHMSCQEDEEFVSALDKMVSDNIQERMRETVKPPQVDISVPMSLRSAKKTYNQLQVIFEIHKIIIKIELSFIISIFILKYKRYGDGGFYVAIDLNSYLNWITFIAAQCN